MRRFLISILSLAALAAMTNRSLGAEPAKVPLAKQAAGLDLFEKRIRPVLVKHCYECHSAESKEVEGGLLLDTRAGIRRGGETGPAVVPAKIKDSLIISALEHDDLEMPPKAKLPDAVIADFRRWIDLGAPDPREGGAAVTKSESIDIEKGRQFWSFQLPKKHPLPSVKNLDWAKGDIDRFILAKIEAAKIKPSEDADRETLIRRATFALTGLPPTPAEIDAFVADKSLDAFAKVVDRLLASPHFGERWARHWLDIARYAESSGGGRTLIFNNAWRYRDYVIRSFNADKRFDQFLKEQIAGDLMPHENLDQRKERTIATGFLALGPTNFELQDKELLRMEVIDEQLDTIGRGMLGMTIGCARCHDHKFDPIPTRDYYALAGIFGSIKSFNPGNVAQPIEVALLSTAEEQLLAAHKKKVAAVQSQIATLDKRRKQLSTAIAKATGKTVTSGSKGSPSSGIDPTKLAGIVVDNTKAKFVGSWKHSTSVKGYLGDGYVHDDNIEKGKKSITFAAKLPRDGQYEVRVSYTAGPNRDKAVPVTVRFADGEKTARIDQIKSPPIRGSFASLGTFRFAADKEALVRISNEGTRQHVIADAVQFLPQSGAEANDSATTKNKKNSDKKKRGRRQNKSQPKLSKAGVPEAKKDLASIGRELKSLKAKLADLNKKSPKGGVRALTIAENKPLDEHVRIRGALRSRGALVPRGALQVATYGDAIQILKSQSGRLQLAEWVANERNPLTARVMANRIWHHLFGEGIVRTPDNFGSMGQRPTHPELLDHLALRFVENQWSVKKMIREIMLSRTWQLSSQPTPSALKVDPENRLLAHAHRRRLDAEAIRDALLSVSGMLDLTPFGRTMKQGTKSELTYKFTSLRRSVYVPSFRNTQIDLLRAFDAANPNVVTGHRTPSTLPTQALLMMNSPTVIEHSRHAAEKLLADLADKDNADRLTEFYRRTLGRPPRDAESKKMLAYLDEQRKQKIDEVTAWAQVSQAVFASIDFRYVY